MLYFLAPAAAGHAMYSSVYAAAVGIGVHERHIAEHGAKRASPIIIKEADAYYDINGYIPPQLLGGNRKEGFTRISPRTMHFSRRAPSALLRSGS